MLSFNFTFLFFLKMSNQINTTKTGMALTQYYKIIHVVKKPEALNILN